MCAVSLDQGARCTCVEKIEASPVTQEASLQTPEPLKLPTPKGALTYKEVLAALLDAQLLCNPEKGLVEALRENLDPHRRWSRRVDFAEGKCAQAPGLKAKTENMNLECFRLNPLNGVWEYETGNRPDACACNPSRHLFPF